MTTTPKKHPLWEADNEFIVLWSKGSTEIATVNTRLKNWRKHARLIAQAPELAELLQEAYDHLDYCGWGDSYEREGPINSKLPDRIKIALDRVKGDEV